MRYTLYFIAFVLLLTAAASVNCTPEAKKENQAQASSKSIYDYSFRSLHDGSEIKLSQFKGKKILLVNTASECGNTPQYDQLEALSKKYADKLVIIGFPANEFGAQEPGSNKEIAEFCRKNYGVTFPMSQKIVVKGEGMDPIFQWLTKKELNGKLDSEVKWNFQKYLVDESGNFVKMFVPRMKPDDPVIIRAIEE